LNNSMKIICGKRETTLAADPYKSILESLREGGQLLSSPCGGKGSCGKCRVRVFGTVICSDGSKKTLAGEEVPACSVKPLCGCTVHIPEEAEMPIPVSLPERIEPCGEGLAAAVDIGTTTAALAVYDRSSGALLGSASDRNAQRSFGADVISRIECCKNGGLPLLRNAIRTQITELITRTGYSPDTIAETVIAGNTVMEHIAAGLDPSSIGTPPFTPLSLFGEELGREYYCPCVSGYVGGDISAGLFASGGASAEGLWLYVDIGTNGEIALGNRYGFICSATAAGPALEGAEISCGMNASEGAIDRVAAVQGELEVHTVGGAEARGICGSGLIDAVSALLSLGTVDKRGRIIGAREARLTENVALTRQDIRNLQLAKAAIRAGIETLLEHAGKAAEDITRLVIAGGFGSYIDPESAMSIGLLPRIEAERTVRAGAAAIYGAAELIDRRKRAKLRQFCEKLGYVDLSSSGRFSELFIEHLNF